MPEPKFYRFVFRAYCFRAYCFAFLHYFFILGSNEFRSVNFAFYSWTVCERSTFCSLTVCERSTFCSLTVRKRSTFCSFTVRNDPHFVRCIVKVCYKNRSFNKNTNVWHILIKKSFILQENDDFSKSLEKFVCRMKRSFFFQDCSNDLNFCFRSTT